MVRQLRNTEGSISIKHGSLMLRIGKSMLSNVEIKEYINYKTTNINSKLIQKAIYKTTQNAVKWLFIKF